MKKPIFLFIGFLFLTGGIVMAQTPTNTQFPNPGFEKWTSHGKAGNVPNRWHTFDELKCDLSGVASIGCGTAKSNHHNDVSGFRGSHAVQLYCKTILGVPANGALSTGRTRVASTNARNAGNYNYLTAESGYEGGFPFYWAFVGCPDSVSFYYKTDFSSPDKPYLKVFTVTGMPFYDKASGELTPKSSIVGAADIRTLPQSSSWRRGKSKVTYTHPNNTDGNAGTLTRPSYMLASFSTSTVSGSGKNGDKMTIDEVFCIYDKGLSMLTIDGEEQLGLLAAFNAAEFATHEPMRTYNENGDPEALFNCGTCTSPYAASLADNKIPVVAAAPKSDLVSEFTVTQASEANGYKAAIHVRHNDNSTFDYYILFIPDNSSITLNNERAD